MLANKLNIMNQSVEKQINDQKNKFEQQKKIRKKNGSGGNL
jgi:hypothetical protein